MKGEVDMKRKSLIIPVMLTCVMFLNGCEAKSIDDIYSMASTEATTVAGDNEPEWHNYKIYEKLPDGKELPELQAAGEKIDMSLGFNGASKLWATVEEAVLTDNFNDIKNYTDEDSAAKIYDYINEQYPGYINEDGTFGIGRHGVVQKGLIIKYHISNEDNNENIFSPPSLYFYDIRYDEAGKIEYYTLYDNVVGIDKPDGWQEHFWDKVTFQPKETKDIVTIVFVDEQRVTRYKSHIDKDNNYKTVIDEVETDGELLNNIYIGAGEKNRNGERGIWTEQQLVKLDIKKKD